MPKARMLMPTMIKKMPTRMPTKAGKIITKIPKAIANAPISWSEFIRLVYTENWPKTVDIPM